EERQADRRDVLLDRRVDDLLRAATDAGVDHLVPGIAEDVGDVLGAAVVAIEARLAEEDAGLLAVAGHRQLLLPGGGVRGPGLKRQSYRLSSGCKDGVILLSVCSRSPTG